MLYIAQQLKDFKYQIVTNPNFKPMKRNEYKNITNTSCIVVWYNTINGKFYYLIQKRSAVMNSGPNKLAVGGGMLEKSDKTLQYGAIREMLEESQLQLRDKNNMSEETIKILSKCLFPISKDNENVTFFFIIASNIMPKWDGPIKENKYPFNKSLREVDVKDTSWNKYVKKGHCFMTYNMIKQYVKDNKNPTFWKYSLYSLKKLFKILEN